ncbi:MAG: PAC2 family protein [Promicromonosporaceae bacterium]|nr:PAC2 family protein [Promicromonosporaceae bacterium]
MTKRPAPVLIAAFSGWNDAGNAASSVIAHLARVWHAEKYVELDPELYQDFQVNRPIVSRGDDGKRHITWPATSIWIARLPHRTYVLVDGIEPSFNWRKYCQEILDVAADLHVETVITLGALLADVPHTRPFPISLTSDNSELQETLDLDFNDYEGPTGIVGVFQHAATAAGLTAVSAWVAVPHYVAEPPSPKASLTLLSRLEEFLDDSIEFGTFPNDAATWAKEIQEMVDDDEDIAEYVAHLEEASDTVESPNASGDAIAMEFESWLRKQ